MQNSKPYVMPLLGVNNGGSNQKRKIIKIVAYRKLLRWRMHFTRTKKYFKKKAELKAKASK